jgi:dipeptidyl-peptidase-4
MNKITIGATLLLSVFSFAQNKKLTMEEAVLGLGTNLRIESLSQTQFIPNQEAFSQVVKTKYGNAVIKTSLPSMKVDTILRPADLGQISPQSVPMLSWLNANEASFQKNNQLYLYNFQANNATPIFELPENVEYQEVDPTGKKWAYVVDNNLFLYDVNENSKHQITKDGSYDIVNGKTVHREEFGIHKGVFFSPKGNLVAFYRMDQSMVEDYPIVNWSTTPAVNQNIKYPFAGRTSHQVTLGIYNPATKTTQFLNVEGPKDQYLTSVSWSPDEKSIYVGVLNRDQNHLKLNQYDAQSGKLIKTLFEEKHDKYVEPQNELYFLNNKEFVWWSQRDGFMHLYRYDVNGKLINQITKGNWIVNEILAKNDKKKELIITSTKDGAMEKHVYAVNWENGKINRLDADAGYHNAMVNDLGTYVLDNWSNETTPRKIDVYSTDGKFKKNLLTAKNPLANYQMPKVENVTLKADDGTDLYGKLIYPTDFDSSKKYPVIVYLYNGPHAQMNLNRFPASGNLWYDYMAQSGYVVWVMDGRGSSNRGLAFEQAIFRNLGDVEMADQMKGVEFLKSKSFVDGDRMGIHGWSYGGFMTTSFMLRQPDVFKAGVAGGPVMDWSLYEIMYGERYMDTPETNPEGYAKNNLLDKTKNLKGKLLLIHGTDDPVVVWQHSIDFLRNAVSEGVQVDYFVYPGYEHNVRGKDRVHLMQKVTDYFDLHLKK